MKEVNENGEVFETSFHHINENHENLVVEGRLSAKVPCHGFSREAHIDLILRLSKECKCTLTEEDANSKT
jgi:hypothetical protein